MTSAHHEEVGRRVGAAGAGDNSNSKGPGRSGGGPRGAPWHAPVSRRPGRARGPGGARRGSGACAPAAPPRTAGALRGSRAPARPRNAVADSLGASEPAPVVASPKRGPPVVAPEGRARQPRLPTWKILGGKKTKGVRLGF